MYERETKRKTWEDISFCHAPISHVRKLKSRQGIRASLHSEVGKEGRKNREERISREE